MLIHKNRKELEVLVLSLLALPIEGKELAEIMYKERTRQQTLNSMRKNIRSQNSITTVTSNVATYATDCPTTLIDDYWGLRLGLVRG